MTAHPPGDGTQLAFDLREHDLPPLWDGHPVVWEPWRASVEPLICPPPKDRRTCDCGSTTPSLTANGTRTVAFGDNVVRIGRGNLHPRERADRLVAMRCGDCGRDVVWDLATDQWWDLDDSDYLDTGSWSSS